jgi:YVTN family beta-propeller protein
MTMHRFALLLLAFTSFAHAETLVVVNKGDNDISLIDLASGETRARLPAGDGPHEVATSPDGQFALVTGYGRLRPGNTLTLLDIAQRQVLNTYSLGNHTWPHGIVWSGATAWVTVENENNNGALLGVNPADGSMTAALPAAQPSTHMVALAPDRQRAFASNIVSGSVSVFDLNTSQRIAILPSGEGAEGIAVTPDGSELWVANQDDDDIAIFDARTLALLARIQAPNRPIRVAFTPDGRRALVTCARTNQLAVFDVNSRGLITHVHFPHDKVVPQWPYGSAQNAIGVLVPPDGNRAFVALLPNREIAEIDLRDYSIVRYIPTGRQPDGMAWSPVTLPAQ